MDELLFALKRAHLASNRWGLRLLAKFGVTPARFDLMRIVYERGSSIEQHWLRERLGVARSTLSRMLRSLERLGWVRRTRSEWDGRTRHVELTYAARSLVWRILTELVRSRVVADEVDGALAIEREVAETACWRIVWQLGRLRVLTVGLEHASAWYPFDG